MAPVELLQLSVRLAATPVTPSAGELSVGDNGGLTAVAKLAVDQLLVPDEILDLTCQLYVVPLESPLTAIEDPVTFELATDPLEPEACTS
ncbi:MAG: hypothetical protein AABZ02_13135 [Bacteroidota bacterium]